VSKKRRDTARHYSLHWLSYLLGVPDARIVHLAKTANTSYFPFPLRRRGKKDREIDKPSDELMELQRTIRERVLSAIPLSEIAHGCVKDRSAETNAARHIGQPSIASVDIKKCYPSITHRMVFRFFCDQLHLGENLAGILTQLTTWKGHLPTGAPTSDALANLILSAVDTDIEKIAERLQLHATRYLDNIDLSGRESANAIEPTIRSIQKLGLAVSRKKVFNAGATKARRVTGLNVDRKSPMLSKADRNNVRAACHELILASERGDSIEKLLKQLRGRIAHVKKTNPQDARRFRKQLAAAGIVV
jgi:RNA-directed DNA polymerase